MIKNINLLLVFPRSAAGGGRTSGAAIPGICRAAVVFGLAAALIAKPRPKL